jgi:KRAB domain-containing zinc finger protein
MSSNFNCDVCNKKFLNKTAFHFHQKWSHILEDRQNGSKEQLEETEVEEREETEVELEEIEETKVELEENGDQNIQIDLLNDANPTLKTFAKRSSNNKINLNQIKNNNPALLTLTLKRLKRNLEIDPIADINPELEKLIIERYLKRKANNYLDDKNEMKNPEDTSLMKQKDESGNRSHQISTKRKYLLNQKNKNKPKRFQCHLCSKSFKQKKRYKDHIKTAHNNENLLYKCGLCKKSFPLKRNLQLHTMAVHEKLRPFKCELCEQSFSQKGNFKSHLKKVHNEENIPKETPDEDDKQKLRPYKCQICEKYFSQKGNLKRHLKEVHKEETIPVEAQDDEIEQTTLHFKSHNSRKPENRQLYQCDICKQCFSQKCNLESHLLRVHNETVVPMEVIELDKNNLQLDQSSVHENLKPFECQICKQCFSQKCNLESHLQRVHNDTVAPMEDIEGDMIQNKNNLQLDQKCNLKTHIHKVHNDMAIPMFDEEGDKMQNKNNPYLECQICQNSFSQKVHFKRHHQEVHEKLKPHKCPECQKCSSRKDYMKTHNKRCHTRNNSERTKNLNQNQTCGKQCPICQKSFSTKNHLKSHHQEVHEKLKPHECPECQKCFSRKHDMKSHMKRLHKINNSNTNNLNPDQTCDKQCKICKIVFISSRTLQLHSKFVHNNCEM